ncbi:protein of unknown function [Cognatiyoonia koreensis]|uniref:YjiS-like domain-containing protein n=1 Tax=Cognatiyoonia koreensis TaxID=364200 RepID=A0A1I0ML16_9RHOB|nr:DUF1127 domain-containing protein [Cognatiyoonia koreensis]SEV89136.1 protein of unknown function [Cognatiyoonia koreensis]
MAAFDTTRPVAVGAGRFSRLASDLFGSIAAWNDARLTRKALSQLTARELDDIGLTRADVDQM